MCMSGPADAIILPLSVTDMCILVVVVYDNSVSILIFPLAPLFL